MTLIPLLVVAALTVTPATGAQPRDAEARRDRMRTFLVLRISEALNLPEDKALQISKILREAEDRRRNLVSERREVERQLRRALEQHGESDPAAFSQLIAKANELDGQIAMLPETSFRQVQEVLTVEQQARLILLRPEMQAQIRRNVERRLRGR